MTKLTLQDPANLINNSATGVIASNNRAVEDAIENTLSRDGTAPNEMNADLDMNSNQILNLPAATTSTEPVRKAEYDDLVAIVNADANSKAVTIGFVIDGGGNVITTGLKGYIEIPFQCTLERYTLLPNVFGSIVVDIWKVPYSSFLGGITPSDSNSITGSAPPTLSSNWKAQSSTLTGWTTTINDGDILAFNVDSASTVTRVTLSLKASKP